MLFNWIAISDIVGKNPFHPAKKPKAGPKAHPCHDDEYP
jgi:hypothetical protein